MISRNKSFVLFLLLLNLTHLKAQTWDWLQTIRPGGNEYVWDITNDLNGNILATGRVKAYSTFGSGTYTQSPAPISLYETDVFVAKYRSNGDLVWVKRDGSKEPDWGRDVTTDNQGNVFVTGDYCDTASFGVYQVIGVGASQNRNIFLAKYDSTGVCQWVKSAGNAANYSRGYGVTTDSVGNCYITGHISGAANFDGVTFGVNGYNVPFIAKFSPLGTCIWAKRISVTVGGEGNAINIDKYGNLLVTGAFRGTLYAGTATHVGNSASWSDVFLIKMDTSGAVIWSASAIGAYQDMANAIDSDQNGNVYISGTFANNLAFGTTTISSMGWGANATTANAGIDAFIAKYNKNGVFKWVKTIGNLAEVVMDDIEITNSDKILVAGSVRGPDLNLVGTSFLMDTANISYVMEFDTIGNVLWYKLDNQIGRAAVPRGVCADIYGNCYIGGEFLGDPYMDFDSITIQSYSGIDGYIAKLYPPLEPVIAANYTTVCPGEDVYFSTAQEGFPLIYEWDFPGATPSTSTLANPLVNYPFAGTYAATLIISNGHQTDTVSVSILVTPGACTIVEEYAQNVEVKIAPNPASSMATITVNGLSFNDSDPLTIHLYNYMGQKIEVPQLISNNTCTLMLENLSAGGYFFNIMQNNSIIKTEKLIVYK